MTNKIELKDRMVNEHEAARFMGSAVQSLRNRRFKGLPPTYYKLGRSVRYRLSDLEEYLESCRIDSCTSH